MSESELRQRFLQNLPTILAVPVGGFVLWNLVFMVAALFVNLVGFVFPPDFARTSAWFMPVIMGSYALFIMVIAWFAIRSRLDPLFKAVFITMPLAVFYVTVAVLLWRWPFVSYIINAFVFSAIVTYLFQTKKPWVYLYSVLFTTLTLLIFTLAGGEI